MKALLSKQLRIALVFALVCVSVVLSFQNCSKVQFGAVQQSSNAPTSNSSTSLPVPNNTNPAPSVSKSCDPIPGVVTDKWTGSIQVVSKSQVVRAGTACPVSKFTCDLSSGAASILLDGQKFDNTLANKKISDYSTDLNACVQVPKYLCGLYYSYSPAGVTTTWSFSQPLDGRYVDYNSAQSYATCSGIEGKTYKVKLSDLANISSFGPLNPSYSINCKISIADVLGNVSSCGGQDSIRCDVKVTTDSVTGHAIASWNLSGYDSGPNSNVRYRINGGTVSDPAQLQASPFSSTGYDLGAGAWNIFVVLSKGTQLMGCGASGGVPSSPSSGAACPKDAPLLVNGSDVGIRKNVSANGSGTCECAGGLKYDPSLRNGQGACTNSCSPDRVLMKSGSDYVCSKCLDRTLTTNSGGNVVVPGTLISGACYYPGFVNQQFYGKSGSCASPKLPMMGFPGGIDANKVASVTWDTKSDYGVCRANRVDDSIFQVDCQKTFQNDNICASATGTEGSSGFGGGVNSVPAY